jgi:aspartyl-tRNA(Asn)/glutamyl-tRNA(Gln) amidotransferase subunit A
MLVNVMMLVYPKLTQLDLTGPFEVLAHVDELSIHLVAKTLDPVVDSGGLRLLPTVTYEDCPQADILFVPDLYVPFLFFSFLEGSRMSSLAFSSLTSLAAQLRAGSLSSRELTALYLDRIAQADKALHSYVCVDHKGALALADAADARRAAGYCLGPLDGLPIAIKDLCDIEGRITTFGSQAWLERRSTITATVVTRLLAAGMVMLGKTHMVEFAYGGWGMNPVMGTPRNPWDMKAARIPGGSSSGSGVAVAAGLAPAALGSDTGGSVRTPAALNGVTGLKTSRGLISLYGALPLSSTLDTIGFLTRTAEDALLLTSAVAGADANDPIALARAGSFEIALLSGAKPLAGMRIAVMPQTQYPTGVDDDIVAGLNDAGKTLEQLGATLIEAPIPFDFPSLVAVQATITASEAYAYHHRYIDDAALPLGAHVRSRVLKGKTIGAANYIEALNAHREASGRWKSWMRDYDALLAPCAPFSAGLQAEVDESQLTSGAFTRVGNLLNSAALALPTGFSHDGLPIGMQLMGEPGSEGRLCSIGAAFQRATDWHERTPDLSTLGI